MLSLVLRWAACGCVLACLAVLKASPAAAANPDISVIGDTRAVWSEDTDDVELEYELPCQYDPDERRCANLHRSDCRTGRSGRP